MRFISETYPDLHIPTIAVRFRDGVADVTTRGAIAYLQSPWMRRRGVRLATEEEVQAEAGDADGPVANGEPAAEPDAAGEPATDDGRVPDGTAADVLAWVGDDPDRARRALAAEEAREKPRTSLVAKLNRLVSGAGDGS